VFVSPVPALDSAVAGDALGVTDEADGEPVSGGVGEDEVAGAVDVAGAVGDCVGGGDAGEVPGVGFGDPPGELVGAGVAHVGPADAEV
jgi:hypothetical protein